MNIVDHIKGLIASKQCSELEKFFKNIPNAVLHQKGVEILANAKTPQNDTMLMLSARYGLPHFAEAMMIAGADVNQKNNSEVSPLMVACQYGNLQTAKLFIEKGAALNDKNANGMTALMLAASTGQTQIVEALVHAGADLKVRNHDKRTALQLACEFGHVDAVQILRKKTEDKLLNIIKVPFKTTKSIPMDR